MTSDREEEDRIDAELRAALDVSPPAGFELGVKRRIDARREARRARGRRWFWAAAAAAAVLIARTLDRTPPRPVPVAPVTTVAEAAPALAEVRPEPPKPRPVRRAAIAASPEVLVPRGQAELVQRLVRELGDQPIAVARLGGSENGLSEIVVEPIRVGQMTIEPTVVRGLSIEENRVRPLTLEPNDVEPLSMESNGEGVS